MSEPQPSRIRRRPITRNQRCEMVAAAVQFLGSVYGLNEAQCAALAGTELRWKNGRRRRMAYYRPSKARADRWPYISVAIPPGETAPWVTYDRVHARLTTPRDGIEVPIRLRIVLCLVHEYTHAVQDGVCGGAQRRFLEAEPTKNEIEFVRLHTPEVYAKLVPSRRRSRRPSRKRLDERPSRTDGAGALDRLRSFFDTKPG